MELYDLKVEGRQNPIDISIQNPVFSWKVNTEKGNWRQKGYRIVVCLEGAAVWDSGFLESSRMTDICYEGDPLKPDTRYTWTAECRAMDGEQVKSQEAWFETGLFSEEDWTGRFIGETKDGEYHLFRKEFHVKQKVSRAKLYVCGLGHHVCYLNGKPVSDRVLEPGWTDYENTCFYSTYDVTGLLAEGSNAAGFRLGDGMYHVPGIEGRYVYFKRSYGRCKCRIQLNITYTDGSSESVSTDETWRMAMGPVACCCIYGGEVYDGRLEKPGFSTAGYEERDEWSDALCVEPPRGKVTSCSQPPMKVMQTLEPESVVQTGPGVFLYDFGRNFSGWARMKLQADRRMAGMRIKLTPGEILDSEGRPDQSVTGRGYTWEYILNGNDRQEFAPDFTYTGFRYLQMEGAIPSGFEGEGLSVITSMTGEFIYPEVEQAGDFHCSNSLFNQIHKMINQAVLSNMKSYFTDCPHREKLPWLEQTHLIGPAIMYNYDVHRIYVKQLQDMADSQHEDGLVPDICPEYVVFGYHEGFVDSPEWGSACVINPWYLYKRYGDRSVVESSYDMMKSYVEYLTGRTHHHVLHHGLGDWLDIGPCTPYSQNTAVPLSATSIYYYDLRIMEAAAQLLEKTEDAGYFSRLADQVYREYNLQFLDNQTGRYGTGSQASQALSLVTGLVPDEYQERAVKQLRDEVVKRNYAITAGDIGHPFLIAALMKYQMSDLLNHMTNMTDTPGYGYQVVHGATTLTEEWDGPQPDRPHGSQNHFMLGSIEEWFFSGLAGMITGIRSGLPFDEWRIKPHIAEGMDFCSAWTMHPYGKISVEWKRIGEKAEVTVRIPPNLTAHLESEDGSFQKTVGSGCHTYIVGGRKS